MVAPISTYSILAREAETGRVGVAVQSYRFAAGALVPSAESGVGAAVIQSIPALTRDYGGQGLCAMRAGRSAEEALNDLLAEDDGRDYRQAALVDRLGRVAAHTGKRCVPEAGHAVGEGFACLANMMHGAGVWDAMADAFRSSRGALADRLFAALVAAEAEGGDLRGGQAAALLVVESESHRNPRLERIFDLRVEHHDRPLDELRRLMRLQSAYWHSSRADALLARGDTDEALEGYARAERLAPEEHSLAFWRAVALTNANRVADALPLFERAFDADLHWYLMAQRLPRVGLLPEERKTLARILDLGRTKDEG